MEGDRALRQYRTHTFEISQHMRYMYLIIVFVKENFYLLHNNTIKTISKTAKSSVLIAIVYHLES